MKTINALVLAVVILVTACQKEITKNSPANTGSGVTASSSIPGVKFTKDGVPYPNIQTASGFADDEIGWHIDVGAVSSGYANTTPRGPVSSLGGSELYCGGIHTVNLYAGQNILMGTVEYANDAQNLYVTYTTNPDWFMSEVHLYAGPLATAPLSGGGTPSPGKFPIKSTFTASSLSQSVTYTIPISVLLNGTFIIAAHASVLRVDVDGDVIAKETAWASGTRFQSNKNWATYITTNLDYCGGGPADLSGKSSTN